MDHEKQQREDEEGGNATNDQTHSTGHWVKQTVAICYIKRTKQACYFCWRLIFLDDVLSVTERERSENSLAWFNTSPHIKNVRQLWIIRWFICLLQGDLSVSSNILIGKRDKVSKGSGPWEQEGGKINSILHTRFSPRHGCCCYTREDSKPGSHGKGLRTGTSTHYFCTASGHLPLHISNTAIIIKLSAPKLHVSLVLRLAPLSDRN